jgi:hypothetical protein
MRMISLYKLHTTVCRLYEVRSRAIVLRISCCSSETNSTDAPSREVGQFRSKRRIDLSELGSELVALDQGGGVGRLTTTLFLLCLHLAKPLAKPTYSFMHAVASEETILHVAPSGSHV